MESMTHREYRTRIAWLDEQWHQPTKTDYYLMQIAGHVANVLSKKRWKLLDYLLNFRVGSKKRGSGRSDTEKTASAKAAWAQRAAMSMEKNRGSK